MVTVFLMEHSITLLIDTHSVFVPPLLAQISVFLSVSLHFSLCLVVLSSTSLNQTVTGGGAAFPVSGSLPSSFLFTLSFPVLRQIECQGAPHEFPAPGSDPILLGGLRGCEFFRRLKLSGGQKFTLRPVDVGQGHPSTHTYTQTTCSPELAGGFG